METTANASRPRPASLAQVDDATFERALNLQAREWRERGRDLGLVKCIALVRQEQRRSEPRT